MDNKTVDQARRAVEEQLQALVDIQSDLELRTNEARLFEVVRQWIEITGQRLRLAIGQDEQLWFTRAWTGFTRRASSRNTIHDFMGLCRNHLEVLRDNLRKQPSIVIRTGRTADASGSAAATSDKPSSLPTFGDPQGQIRRPSSGIPDSLVFLTGLGLVLLPLAFFRVTEGNPLLPYFLIVIASIGGALVGQSITGFLQVRLRFARAGGLHDNSEV